MVVKIRLARFGKRHAPFYNIVVAHARTARNSLPLEVLGTYDPIPRVPIDSNNPTQPTSHSPSTSQPKSKTTKPNTPQRKFKDLRLDTARAKYWLGVGAKPSEPAWRLLSMLGLLEPKLSVKRKMERRAMEEEARNAEEASRGAVEGARMVGVAGEEEGEIRASDVSGEGVGKVENATT